MNLASPKILSRLLSAVFALLAGVATTLTRPALSAPYVGSVSVVSANGSIQSAGLEILGSGGGAGSFTYKGGGNAVDAAVAAGLTACVVNAGNCSLGGYGGHMMIWKSGWDGEPPVLTCIDFNSAAGSLASSNMFVGNVDPVTGVWTGPGQAANQYGWKAAGVPGTFAGLFMAQTNYGRKLGGTNYLPFAEVLKPALARIANGQAPSTAYYTVGSLSNLVMDLYTNSPGYLDANGQPNPYSVNNPHAVFYSGDIALDIAAAMQANGGLVTYADMTNYRPREVTPYMRHFSPPNGTPAWVCAAPLGSSGLSVLEQLAIVEALGWTNGPAGTWDSLHYWHSRAETARLMWKDHFQWLGDPWSGVLPPDFLGNGSTNFCAQILSHATNGYPFACPWDTNEVRLTNGFATTVAQAVDGGTTVSILVHWNDIRYGTCNISTCDQWGNCVAMTFSMGGGFGAQVGLTNRGLVFGQGMALFDPRPGWPNSIGPGKRQVNNMCPIIIVPDSPLGPTNGSAGGRPPLAVGGVGGSTIENNVAMAVMKYLMESPSTRATSPGSWLYNFEGNNTIYMRPSYPTGVQSYLGTVGLTAPGGPPSAGEISFVEGWIPPVLVGQPANTNVSSGATVEFSVTATGLPLFYQWYRDGVALADGGTIAGAQTARLMVASVSSSGSYSVVITNGAGSITSASAGLSVNGAPAIVSQPVSRTNLPGTLAGFAVSAIGNPALTYRWRKNGTNLVDGGSLSGATTPVLTVGPVSNVDAGTYTVGVSNGIGGVTSAPASLVVLNPSATLSFLWSVSPADGQSWMNLSGSTSVPNQRTIAYNALSNHLYVVSRSSNTTSNYVIYVLNATNGALLYTLKTNGIQSAVGKFGIGLVGIAAADDGAIYACNMANDAEGSGGADPTSLFRVYRWANAGSNTTPALIFAGDPSGATGALRWGDNLTVRGTGTNTRVLVDMTYFGSTSGTNGYAAILSPTNAFMTNFSARWFVTTNFADTVGRSLEFDLTNNAIWQKGPDKPLFKISYNPSVSLGGTRISATNVLVLTNFPTGLMGVGLDLTRKLAAGVFSNNPASADTLNLYDISNSNAPVLLDQYSFPTTPRTANNNRISQTFFKNDLLVTFDANNGLMVFRTTADTTPDTVELTDFKKSSNGNFQFAYSNSAGWPYRVFGSSNLVNWQLAGSATQAWPGLFQFTDALTNRSRFYQLRWP